MGYVARCRVDAHSRTCQLARMSVIRVSFLRDAGARRSPRASLARRSAAVAVVVTALVGCARERHQVTEPETAVAHPGVDAERRDLTLPPSAFTLSTYDGSNQSVHPDFVAPGDGWGLPYSYLI